MAILKVDDLELEFVYIQLFRGRIRYGHRVRWRGVDVINPKLLERGDDDWKTEIFGGELHEHAENNGLASLLEVVLKTGVFRVWKPIDEDVIFAAFPGMQFPYLDTMRMTDQWCEGLRNIRLSVEAGEPIEPRVLLHPDNFTLMAFVNTGNFEGAW